MTITGGTYAGGNGGNGGNGGTGGTGHGSSSGGSGGSGGNAGSGGTGIVAVTGSTVTITGGTFTGGTAGTPGALGTFGTATGGNNGLSGHAGTVGTNGYGIETTGGTIDVYGTIDSVNGVTYTGTTPDDLTGSGFFTITYATNVTTTIDYNNASGSIVLEGLAVPEPSTTATLLIALLGVSTLILRKRRASNTIGC